MEESTVGQVRQEGATATFAIMAAIRRSHAEGPPSFEGGTAGPYNGREPGIDAKTVAKWRKRAKVDDRKIGPKEPR